MCRSALVTAISDGFPTLAALFDPPLKPLEIPLHLLALLRGLAQDVSASRVDVELHRLAHGLECPIELPSPRNGHARVGFAVLDQQRRRHAIGERQR